MARPKLPEDKLKETVGIKLPPGAIESLKVKAEEQDRKPSAVGRDMLLLGLSIAESETVEETLKSAFLFGGEPFTDEEIEKLRPFMEMLDREIDRLAELKKQSEQAP